MNLVEALTYCSDELVKYGGHELAAGLTVKRGKLEEFRRKINEYADTVFTEDMFKIRVDVDCELRASDISLKFAKDILQLEPFGVGNASPVFLMKDATVKGIRYMGGGKHTRLVLEKGCETFSAVYFGVGSGELGFDEGDSIDILFNLGINEYKNTRRVQLTIQDVKISEALFVRSADMSERYDQIHSGGGYNLSENIFPSRDDFARVYTVLRREFRNGTSVLDRKSIMKMVNVAHQPIINHVKLKYIFLVFNELQICEVDEMDKDIYRFNVFFNANKTNIEKSSILKKLKGQCLDRISND
jgi:single-stranded-DNA-specific exonuclease